MLRVIYRVAFAFASLVLLLMEIARITRLPPFQGVDEFMKSYVDSRDQGPLILTHFSLLLGCAFPLWIVSDDLLVNGRKCNVHSIHRYSI